jgi:hypothetical protein
MHAVSHSLTHHSYHWQPYNSLRSISAHSSPAAYLLTPASSVSSVSSASPTPPQALAVCRNDHLQHTMLELSHKFSGNCPFVMSIQPIPHLQLIFLPLHHLYHLYHQHHPLPLRHSLYAEMIISNIPCWSCLTSFLGIAHL